MTVVIFQPILRIKDNSFVIDSITFTKFIQFCPSAFIVSLCHCSLKR